MNIDIRSRDLLISLSQWGKVIGLLSIFNVVLFLYYAFSQGLLSEEESDIIISSSISIPFFQYGTPIFGILFFLVPAILLTIASFTLYDVSYNDNTQYFNKALRFLRLHFQYCLIGNVFLLLSFWGVIFYVIYLSKQLGQNP